MRDLLTDILQTRTPSASYCADGVLCRLGRVILPRCSAQGFERNLEYEYDDATNSLVWRGRTSKSHQGHASGRRVEFTNRDLQAIQNQLAGSEYVAEATTHPLVHPRNIRRAERSV